MRRDPRLIAVPVVAAIVATTWIAAATLPSPKGAIASRSSVVAVRQATLVCPQAGGPAGRVGWPSSRTPIRVSPKARSGRVLLGARGEQCTGQPSAGEYSSPASVAPVTKAAVSAAPPKSAPASKAPASSAPASNAAGSNAASSAPASSAPVSSAPVSSAPTTSAAPTFANPDVSVLTAGALGSQLPPEAIALQPGRAWAVNGPDEQTPVELGVGGPVTESLGAVQVNRTVAGSVPQLAAAPCEGPTTDAWFAGFSSQAGTHATLYLSNVDLVPATIDVSIWATSVARSIPSEVSGSTRKRRSRYPWISSHRPDCWGRDVVASSVAQCPR